MAIVSARGCGFRFPNIDLPLEANGVSRMVDHVRALPEDTKLMIFAPVVANRKGEQIDLFAKLRAQGSVRLRARRSFRIRICKLLRDRPVRH